MAEDDGIGRKLTAMYVGVVTRNDDPAMLARVKVRIPGLLEPESGWALPMGAPGGGAKRRGMVAVPPVGAEVAVFFHAGEADRPYFMAANWGHGELPGPVGGYAHPDAAGKPGVPEAFEAGDAPKVFAFELGKWILVFDDRDGRERFYVEHKVKGDHVFMDGTAGAMEIKASALVSIKSDGIINIDAPQVNVRGRPVMANGKVIGLWRSTSVPHLGRFKAR